MTASVHARRRTKAAATATPTQAPTELTGRADATMPLPEPAGMINTGEALAVPLTVFAALPPHAGQATQPPRAQSAVDVAEHQLAHCPALQPPPLGLAVGVAIAGFFGACFVPPPTLPPLRAAGGTAAVGEGEATALLEAAVELGVDGVPAAGLASFDAVPLFFVLVPLDGLLPGALVAGALVAGALLAAPALAAPALAADGGAPDLSDGGLLFDDLVLLLLCL